MDILLVDEDLVAFGTELLLGKEVDGLSGLGKSDKLGSVQSCGIVQDTRTINNGNGLVLAEQDLVCLSVWCPPRCSSALTRSKISIGTTSLELGDIPLA